MPAPSPAPAAPAARPHFLRLLSAALALMGVAAVLLVAGFVLFASGLERGETKLERSADGIAVLTGGADRIADAMGLLAAGRGQRLLITGVHPETTLDEIGRGLPTGRERLECCVDVGRSALNTRGNAIETASWVRARRFRSLIVVTSSWHMPRALVELRRAMPGVDLLPYPVVSERMRTEPWWTNPATARLLFLEYLKFLAAHVPYRPGPALSSDPA